MGREKIEHTSLFFAIHYTRDLLSIPCHIFILVCVCVYELYARVYVYIWYVLENVKFG